MHPQDSLEVGKTFGGRPQPIRRELVSELQYAGPLNSIFRRTGRGARLIEIDEDLRAAPSRPALDCLPNLVFSPGRCAARRRTKSLPEDSDQQIGILDLKHWVN